MRRCPIPCSSRWNGAAIHGTYEPGLGRPVSHGCVRLSLANAATLWNLVQRENMMSTTVQVTGTSPNAFGPMARRFPPNAQGQFLTRSGPIPPAAIGPYAQGAYPPPPPYGQPRPLFPFFASGR